MPPHACPDRARLHQLLVGDIPQPAADDLFDHVDACTRCQDVIESFPDDVTSDPLAASLAGLPDSVHGTESQVFDRFAERVLVASRDTERFTTSTLSTNSLPTEIGQYEILGLIGFGGMGAVFEARHRRLGRRFALKVLSSEPGGADSRIAQITGEWLAHGQLVHPNIVLATDAGIHEDQAYLVTELVLGCDLEQLVKQRGPLTMQQACEIIRQAAEGLWHAHRQRILHRDIKPSNLMLDLSGCVKLLDLGLAAFESPPADQTDVADDTETIGERKPFRGTLNYMAPECASSPQRDVDARSDQYSLGCTLFYLLTGRPPFAPPRFTTKQSVLDAHRMAEIPTVPSADFESPLGQRLNALLARMLAKQPQDRFAHLGEVIEAMGPLANATSIRPLVDFVSSLRPAHSETDVDLQRGAFGFQDAPRANDFAPLGSAQRTSTAAPTATTESRHLHSRSWVAAVAALMAFGGLLGSVLILVPTITALWRVDDREDDRVSVSNSPAMLRMGIPGDEPLSPASVIGLVLQSRSTSDHGDARQVETRGPRGMVDALAWSPDGRRLAVHSGDGQVRIYDYQPDQTEPLIVSKIIAFPCSVCMGLTWSADSKAFAIAGRTPHASRLILYDVESGTQHALEPPPDEIRDIVQLPASEAWIVALANSLILWKPGDETHQVIASGVQATALCGLPSAQARLPSTLDANAVAHGASDVTHPRIAFVDRLQKQFVIAGISDDSAHRLVSIAAHPCPPLGEPLEIVSATDLQKIICAYETAVEILSMSGEFISRISAQPESSVTSIDWNPRHQLLAIGHVGGWRLASEFDPLRWQTTSPITSPSTFFSDYKMAWHPDGSRVAVGLHGKVVLYDTVGAQRGLVDSGGVVIAVEAVDNGFALCNQYGDVLIADRFGSHTRQVTNQLEPSLSALSLDALDGQSTLAVCYAERPLPELLNTSAPTQRETTEPSRLEAGGLANSYVIVGSRNQAHARLIYWSATDHRWNPWFPSLANPLLSAISPTRDRIAVGNYARDLEIQSMQDGEVLLSLPFIRQGNLKNIVWSADGQLLIISRDRVSTQDVIAYDASQGSVVWRRRFNNHARPQLNSLALLDRQRLLYSLDDSLVLLDVTTGGQLHRIKLPQSQQYDNMRVAARTGAGSFVTYAKIDQGGAAFVWDANTLTVTASITPAGPKQWLTLSPTGLIVDAPSEHRDELFHIDSAQDGGEMPPSP